MIVFTQKDIFQCVNTNDEAKASSKLVEISYLFSTNSSTFKVINNSVLTAKKIVLSLHFGNPFQEKKKKKTESNEKQRAISIGTVSNGGSVRIGYIWSCFAVCVRLCYASVASRRLGSWQLLFPDGDCASFAFGPCAVAFKVLPYSVVSFRSANK